RRRKRGASRSSQAASCIARRIRPPWRRKARSKASVSLVPSMNMEKSGSNMSSVARARASTARNCSWNEARVSKRWSTGSAMILSAQFDPAVLVPGVQRFQHVVGGLVEQAAFESALVRQHIQHRLVGAPDRERFAVDEHVLAA